MAGTQPPVWMLAIIGLAVLTALSFDIGGWRIGLGALLGGLGGFALYHASFGFTSGWRHFIVNRRGAGLRAQFLLIGLIVLVSFPLIAWSGNINGYVFPFGLTAAFGAFIFGFGMQLGGGCGSGTLYTVGGGSSRMVITLAAFIFGSVLATAHWDLWQGLPRLPAMSLVRSAGPVMAIAIAFAILGLLAWATLIWEKRRHGAIETIGGETTLLRGPWAKVTGAAILAIMAIGTFIILQRPWGITSAFALWGAKIGNAAGVDVASWPYWQYSSALNAPVLADATSVQDFGIMLGALMAAGLAGRFAPTWRIGWRPAMAAIIGGLMMGYGARLAFGCNIGAFLGGVTSGSLHGVGWLIFGFIGSILAVRLRPFFKLD